MTQLKAGDTCPNFKSQQQDEKIVQLADFAGKKLLVFFYPKASTPGCTKQSIAATAAKAAGFSQAHVVIDNGVELTKVY